MTTAAICFAQFYRVTKKRIGTFHMAAEMAGGVEHNPPGFDTRTHTGGDTPALVAPGIAQAGKPEAKLVIAPRQPNGGS
jgi:hypothetical protein